MRPAGFCARWLHPEVYEDFRYLRRLLADDRPPIEYPAGYARRGYWPSEMWTPAPGLWIPRDDARVSRQEVAQSRGLLRASDRGAWLDAKGRVVADPAMAPFTEPRMQY